MWCPCCLRGAHVRAVYTGENGVLANAKPGALFIDSSTIDVDSARAVIGAAIDKSFEMVDAPVSGGVAAATAGTLTFMVGGETASFEKAKPILDVMGKNIFHAGRGWQWSGCEDRQQYAPRHLHDRNMRSV